MYYILVIIFSVYGGAGVSSIQYPFVDLGECQRAGLAIAKTADERHTGNFQYVCVANSRERK